MDELQKKSDVTNNENAFLKAQVDRLHVEVSEYRKKLSSPSLPTIPNTSKSLGRHSWDPKNNFNFEFPKFGINPESKIKPHSLAHNKNPRSPANSNQSDSQSLLNNSELTGLFSADVLSSAERATNDQTPPSLDSESRSNSTNSAIQPLSPSNTASPASSGYNGLTASCITTPESTTDTMDARKSIDADGKKLDRNSFCKEFQTSCGDTRNPNPLARPLSRSKSNDLPALTPGAMTNTSTEASLDFGSFDWLASQNGGDFNPALLGDYRQPQENIMNGDGWFFNDAFTMPEFGTPLTQINSQNTPKKSFMQEIEDVQSGKEPEVVPGEAPQEFLTCNLLWLVLSCHLSTSAYIYFQGSCSEIAKGY